MWIHIQTSELKKQKKQKMDRPDNHKHTIETKGLHDWNLSDTSFNPILIDKLPKSTIAMTFV